MPTLDQWMAMLGPLVLLTGGAAASACVLTRMILVVLERQAILDHPCERSSHTRPTPRGGGWGIVLTLLPAFAVMAWSGDAGMGQVWLLGGMVLLMAVSWLDDVRGLGPAPRLLAQMGAVAAGLSVVPPEADIFQGWLPFALDRLAAGFLWVWFINLFNFMDGIDGIAGAEAAAVGFGIVLVTILAPAGLDLAWQAALIAGAALGFLVWNWHPARVFMGDVGSIPLGYLLGALLLDLASRGLWLPALILPLYFLADATLTLLRRLARGQRIWQPHRQHFYQQAVRSGRSHAKVTGWVIAANLLLVGLAAASLWIGLFALGPAAAVVGGLLFLMARPVADP